MPIYMDYDGITGDVTAEGWAKKIECFSFQFGVGRGIGAPTGNTADREASAPSVSEIVITKNQDKSSGQLFQAALEGEGKKVVIHLVKTDKGQLEEYLQYELTNTLVSGFSLSTGGDRPTESVSLNFTKIQMKLTTMNDDNSTGDPFVVTYDLSKAVTS